MQYGVPYWLAFAFAVVATSIIGMVIELTVVRRLFDSPRLVLLIATVGVGQLLLFLRISLPKIDAGGAFPLPFTGRWQPTDQLIVLPREVLVLCVAPVVILALALFMTRTSFGLAVRASSSNADTARVYGISVKRTSTIVWTIAAAFAAITGILVAPLLSVTPGNIVAAGGIAIGPALLLRALVVALIARMESLPMTIVGGIAVGVFERFVIANVGPRDQSVVDLYLFIAALVLVTMVVRNRRDETGWALSAHVKPIPERLRSLWYVRHLPLIGFTVLFGFFAILPLFLHQQSQQFLWTEIVIYALVALSITPLAGWAGQLSLGQFAFVGLGSLTMVVLRAGLDIPMPFNLADVSVQMAWFPAVVCSTLVGVFAAIIIGVPALRARGLFLAVITLAFAVMCSNWLFRLPLFTGSEFGTTTPRIAPPVIGNVDFSNRRSLYYLCYAVLVVTTIIVARLRRTGIGRSMIAVRDNEDMAAASTGRPEPDQGHVVRGVGRHRRARRLPAHHVAPTGHADPGVHARGVAAGRRDRGDRWPRLDRGPGDRRALGARPPGDLQRHCPGPAVHEQHRPARALDVLPRRAHADRVQPARRGARVGRSAPRRSRVGRAGARDREGRPDARHPPRGSSRRDTVARAARRERAFRRQPCGRSRDARRARRGVRRSDRHQRRGQVDVDERDRRVRSRERRGRVARPRRQPLPCVPAASRRPRSRLPSRRGCTRR